MDLIASYLRGFVAGSGIPLWILNEAMRTGTANKGNAETSKASKIASHAALLEKKDPCKMSGRKSLIGTREELVCT